MRPRQKILIVDDKPENLFTLEKILSGTGAEIIKATSGNDALVASLHHEFALAIIDVQMPEMDGYELAEFLRSEERTKHLPIVFLSAVYSDEYHIFKGYEAGAVDFITKPFDRRILTGKVKIFLEIDRQRMERSEHLARMRNLIRVSTGLLAESSTEGMLQRIVDAACELTGAQLVVCRYEDGAFRAGTVSGSESMPSCSPEEVLCVERSRAYLELIGDRRSLRLSGQELRSHPALREDSERLAFLGGVVGVPLEGRNGDAKGLILVSKKKGVDFTPEDESILEELAVLASLGLQHIEARSEAELRAAEAETGRRTLEALMEHIPEGITIADAPDVTIRRVSKHGQLLTGKPREYIEGIPVGEHAQKWEIFRSDGVTPAENEDLPLTRATLHGEIVTDEEWALRRTDGGIITILCNAGPIRDSRGRLIGGVIAWRDVTERKEMERALRRANEELEQRVQERTAALETANRALREREKELHHLSSRLLSAHEEERKRIARELHDSIGSSLNAIKFGLENALAQIYQDQAAAVSLKNLISVSQQAIEEARRMMSDLRPSILDDLGILKTVEWFCEQFQVIHPYIHVEKTIGMEEREIPERLKIVLFRILQEAFQNIAKHSSAEFVEISLWKRDHFMELVIEDNGVGFDLDSALKDGRRRGLGLSSMKERTELSGGSFLLDSVVGESTTVRAFWPYENEDAREFSGQRPTVPSEGRGGKRFV